MLDPSLACPWLCPNADAARKVIQFAARKLIHPASRSYAFRDPFGKAASPSSVAFSSVEPRFRIR